MGWITILFVALIFCYYYEKNKFDKDPNIINGKIENIEICIYKGKSINLRPWYKFYIKLENGEHVSIIVKQRRHEDLNKFIGQKIKARVLNDGKYKTNLELLRYKNGIPILIAFFLVYYVLIITSVLLYISEKYGDVLMELIFQNIFH